MTKQEIKQGFNQAIEQMEDSDMIAKAEILREWFTNPEFQEELKQYTWEIGEKQDG